MWLSGNFIRIICIRWLLPAVLGAVLMIPGNTKAESYYVQWLKSDKGIQRANYSSIFEDSRGFLWLCTHTGLKQFSGSNLKKYTPGSAAGQGLETEFFYQMTEDKNGVLWIATRRGLSRMDTDRLQVVTFLYDNRDEQTIPNNRIFSLQAYNDTILFLACDRSGIVNFNTRTLKADRIIPETVGMEKLPENFWVREYFIHNDTVIFVRTPAGYFHYNPLRQTVSNITDFLPPGLGISSVSNFFKDNRGYFWFYNEHNSLFKWLPGASITEIRNELAQEAVKNGVSGIFNFDSVRILINTPGQNFLVSSADNSIIKVWFNYEFGENFGSAAISAVLRTSDNSVFLANRDGMLGHINPNEQIFQHTTLINPGTRGPINFNFVFDDTLFHKRYISNFTHEAVFVEDLLSGEITRIKKYTFGNVSGNKILIDSKGRLFICQHQGIMEVDRATLTTRYHQPTTEAHAIFDIAEVRPGVMMVGSFRSGLFRFEPDAGIFEKIPETNGWISTQIFSLKYDPAHDILWIGTVRNGSFRYDVRAETFKQYLPEPGNNGSIGGDWVREIAIDSAGYVWMAVDPGGLSRFDYQAPAGSEFMTISSRHGLPSNHVGGLGVAVDGTIWATTLNGLVAVNPDNFSIKPWEVENGEHNHGFYYANLSISPTNEVLIGTLYGYLKFNPSLLRKNTTPPKVYVTDLAVMEKDGLVSWGHPKRGVKLRYNQNYFSIEYAVINFINPGLNNVYYSLSGAQPAWQEVKGSSIINFSGISPGRYSFMLKAQNGDGVWSENELVFPLIIRPPFWQTWWFMLFVLLNAGAITYTAVRMRIKQIMKENRLRTEKEILKSEMEKEKASLEMLALRSQMNPHFIFNCLNSINRFILVNDNDTASEYLTKFSRLIRLVLENSRNDKILLRKELETVHLYLEMEKLRFIDKFDFEITIDPALLDKNLLIQPMLIQPYAENAIWHGLMHKSTGGKLTIGMQEQNNQLIVFIRDNGIGRKKSMEIKARQLIHHQSHGMKITAKRLEMLNEKLDAQSVVSVTDLFDAENNACGTLVELTLPIDTPVISHGNPDNK